MNDQEVDKMEDLKEASQNEEFMSSLTRWQREFIPDIVARYEQYDTNTFISGRQWVKINEALDDYYKWEGNS